MALYLVRIPTRFIVIYLGAKNANIIDVIYVVLFSLLLIAWIKDAPASLLKKTYCMPDTGTWIQRIDFRLLRQLFINLGSATIMAVLFYSAGKYLF